MPCKKVNQGTDILDPPAAPTRATKKHQNHLRVVFSFVDPANIHSKCPQTFNEEAFLKLLAF